jgi:hypothetical protein
MAHTTENQTPPKLSAASKPVHPATLIFVLIAVVAIAAGAYWQEDLKGYFQLQAWDMEAPKNVVADFVRDAHASDNSNVANLLAPQITVEKDPSGQVKTVKWVGVTGTITKAPKDIVPPGKPKSLEAFLNQSGELRYFSVITQFANNKWGVFRVQRADGKLVIGEIPPVLGDKRPTSLKFY